MFLKILTVRQTEISRVWAEQGGPFPEFYWRLCPCSAAPGEKPPLRRTFAVRTAGHCTAVSSGAQLCVPSVTWEKVSVE